MSSQTATALKYASQQVAIYGILPIVIAGVIGGILNIIVFSSLKTFRDTTCGFYFLVISIFNVFQLVTAGLSRVLISGFFIDWTTTSVFYCKFRSFLIQVGGLIPLVLLSLATIDQYFATCPRARLQQFNDIKVVRLMNLITVVFCLAFGALYLYYYDIMISSTSGTFVCASTSVIFENYNWYFHRPVMQGILPNLISATFGIGAFLNIQNLAYRAVPLVRRELDKQLTSMLLIQVMIDVVTLFPYNIVSFIVPFVDAEKNSVTEAGIELAELLSYFFYYAYFASPFYIYMAISDRFRRQLAYVIYVKYFHGGHRIDAGHGETPGHH